MPSSDQGLQESQSLREPATVLLNIMNWRLAIVAISVAIIGLPSPHADAAAPAGVGALISQTPIDGAPSGASAWRIRYRSIAAGGASVEITGVVIVPAGPAPKDGRDVVAWAHGTVGIATSCGPSNDPKVFENIAGLPAMLAAGYVVTATDFQGLGTPGPHPYLVGISSGRAVLDSVRAARALVAAQASKRYVMWGESQGAHAVLWAAELAPTYAPELDLLGTAGAAPPTDLIANFAAIENPAARALLTGYTSASWSAIYGLRLSTFTNGIGRYLIHKLAKDCVRLDPASAATNVGLLLLSRQLPDSLGKPWTKPLRDNSVHPVHLSIPLLITQGAQDGVVIRKVTQDFVKMSCHAGNAVRYVSISDGDHSTTGQKSVGITLAWIADRFAHRPPTSDCTGRPF